jgi:hypothetical protein
MCSLGFPEDFDYPNLRALCEIYASVTEVVVMRAAFGAFPLNYELWKRRPTAILSLASNLFAWKSSEYFLALKLATIISKPLYVDE